VFWLAGWRQNACAALARSSAGMPGPLSTTWMYTRSRPAGSTATVTRAPSPANLIALLIRASSVWSSACVAARTGMWSGPDRISSTPARPAA
jgi:hypothetical protein